MRGRFPLILLLVSCIGPLCGAAPDLPRADAQARADARYWEAQGRSDLAQQALTRIMLAHPHDLDILFEIGQLDLRTNQIEDARKMLARMQTLAPKAEETRQMALAFRFATTDSLKLASVNRLLELHRPADAVEALKKLFPDGPPDGDLGVRYFDILDSLSANWHIARDGIAAIAQRYPQDPRYQLALADILVERSQTRQQGLDIASRVAQDDAPERPQALAIWKRGLLRADHLVRTRRSAREYLALAPDDEAIRKWEAQPLQRPSVHTASTPSPRMRARRAREQVYVRMRAQIDRLQKAGRVDSALSLIDGFRAHAAETPDWLDGTESDLLSTAAQADLAAGRQDLALSRMERAQRLAPRDPWARYHLAQLYAQLGLPDEARTLMQQGVQLQPQDQDTRFAQALLLASLEDYAAAQSALDHIPAGKRSDGERSLQVRLLVNSAEQRARRQAAAGDRQMAALTLSSVEDVADQPYQLAALARAWRDLGQPQRGAQLLRRRVAASSSPSPELLLDWAQAESSADDDAGLHQALSRLQARTDLDADQQQEFHRLRAGLALRQIQQLRAQGQSGEALRLLDAAIDADPQDAALRDERADLYRSTDRYPQALADQRWVLANSDEAWRRSRAQDRIASIENRRDGYVTASTSLREKPGDPGISDYTDFELPVEARIPIGYAGHAFVHVDTVRISAGRLPDIYDQAAFFGQVEARGPTSLTRFPGGADQSGTGAALALGYQNDHWRFDLGSTPIGFPVTDVVGGVRFDGSFAGLNLTADLSRRPVTSSYLSYAGAVDPATGEKWGGVRQNGLTLRLAHYAGSFSVSGSVQGSLLTGRNVPTNSYLGAHAGVDWRVLDWHAQRAYVGLSADYLHYRRNLSQYTFGHGGYYSPQQYQSIGVPVEWQGRLGRFTYVLRGSLSFSHSVVDAAPFYPDRPDLQALGSAAGKLPPGYSQPVYDAGGGTGLGKSISGGVEYALTPKWSLGTNFNINRSAYYAPNFFNLYIRRTFLGHDVDDRDYPPDPPQPYSSY